MGTSPRRWAPACGVAAALVLPLLVAPAAAATAAPAAPSGARKTLDISTVSSRPDAVSGGDALVRVDVPAGVAPRTVRVRRDGSDVTRAFRVVGGDLVGRVDRLVPGRHRITATAPRARSGPPACRAHPGGTPPEPPGHALATKKPRW